MYTAGKVKADNKQMVLKNDGEPYILSPYALLMNGDYYYVVGYSHNRDRMATFRVDRIHKKPDILSAKDVEEKYRELARKAAEL